MSEYNELMRDAFILQNEDKPETSETQQVFPKTVLDQVIDQNTIERKTLRQILADIDYKIETGGLGDIIFPVTSVNGDTGDIILTKDKVGLAKVDNTDDMSKPLSNIQRHSIIEMFKDYDFNINLDDIKAHVIDCNNPHKITIKQLNNDNYLTDFVNKLITLHALSNDQKIHRDIRNNLTRLWTIVDGFTGSIDDRMGSLMSDLDTHMHDPVPHYDAMILKEDISNKVLEVNDDNINDTNYPSTEALSKYIGDRLVQFDNSIGNLKNWIDSIGVVETELPMANKSNYRKAYFIKHGIDGKMEFAVCKKENDHYYWDKISLDIPSSFDSDYFIQNSDKGITINIAGLINALLGENGLLGSSLADILKNYYTKEYVDQIFIKHITIVPGDMEGCIQWYYNDDKDNISDNIRITGLKNLAFLETASEDNIEPLSIHNYHIFNGSVDARTVADHSLDNTKLKCTFNHVLGNANNQDSQDAEMVRIDQLAKLIEPYLNIYTTHPHLYRPNEEYYLEDKSCIIRITGTINCLANHHITTILSDKINLKNNTLIDAGGTWTYQSDPRIETILGGSNITGHTFAMITMDELNLKLESISVSDRSDAPYDIWIRYTKKM